MVTGKVVYLLNKMLEENLGERILSSAPSNGVWECQKSGHLHEYGCIPFVNGPFYRCVNGAILFSAMCKIISVHSGYIEFGELYGINLIRDIKKNMNPSEMKKIDDVVKKMGIEGLLTDKKSLEEYWKKEYSKIEWKTISDC